VNIKLYFCIQWYYNKEYQGTQKTKTKKGKIKMTNVLYFEGAGMNFYSEEQTSQSNVGNFRIRTSFLNNEGKQYYVEIGDGRRPTANKNKATNEMFLHVDYFFDVEKQLETPHKRVCLKFDIHELRKLDYTKENIIKLINETLNCSFDTMEVLNEYYGYRVHGDNGSYNTMENIELDHKRATNRKEAYEKIDLEYRSLLNEKYSVITMNEMDQNSITIKCHSSDTKLGDNPRIVQIAV
jgi:hypothetical protein